MQCPRCGHDNRAQAKFCEECASPLTRSCVKCGNPLPPTAKFCPECANPVGAEGATPSRFASPEAYTPKHLAEKIVTSRASLEGERKQVTVLFADMKGSTEPSRTVIPKRPRTPRSGPDAPDGGGPPFRGHRQPGARRRNHGAVRRARPRGPRRPRLLRGAPDAGGRAALLGRASPLPRPRGPDSRRAQFWRSRGALHRERPAHGLHGRRPDDPPGGANGAARAAGKHADQRGDAGPRRGLCPRVAPWAGSHQGARPTGRGLRSRRRERRAHAPPGGSAARPVSLRRPRHELEQLRSALGKAGQGHGQLVAVVGDPGVGKSRLFYEFTHSHRVQDGSSSPSAPRPTARRSPICRSSTS